MKEQLQQLKQIDKEIRLFSQINALLEWDLQTLMPEQGIVQRGEQKGIVSAELHKRATSKELKKIINFLRKKENFAKLQRCDRLIVNKYYKKIKRYEKISQDHVIEYEKLIAETNQVWERAKKCKRFSIVVPNLKKIIAMKKKEAKLVDAKADPYSIFLDDHEEDMTQKQLDKVFEELKGPLQEIIQNITSSSLYKEQQKKKKSLSFNKEGQEKVVQRILELMNIEKSKTVVATAAHPFTITLGLHDVRMTTRYKDEPFPSLLATVHEAGHTLYELGFDEKLNNTILCDAPSFGLHESQSRLWENQFIKNEEFWKNFFPFFKRSFPKEAKGWTAKKIYEEINRVAPTLIRVEADEVTYPMHIIIRYELEKELLHGRLRVEDLPMAWKAKYRKYLGIIPNNDKEGVLQDVHWFWGEFGYFPTYLLRTMYSAMIFRQMQKEMPIKQYLKNGQFTPIISWLKENIHKYGATMTTPEIIMRICKKELSADDFIKYLKEKYYPLYGIQQ